MGLAAYLGLGGVAPRSSEGGVSGGEGGSLQRGPQGRGSETHSGSHVWVSISAGIEGC